MNTRRIYWAAILVALYITLDEIAFYWWRKVYPGHMYSVLNTPSPLVGYKENGVRPLKTPKTDTNRFYPIR